MATIRTKFRSSSAEGREGALYYQVIHNRVVRQISTGYKLFASEWDQRSEAVIPCQHPAGMERDNYLLSVGGTDKTGQNPTGKGYQDIKPIRSVYSG